MWIWIIAGAAGLAVLAFFFSRSVPSRRRPGVNPVPAQSARPGFDARVTWPPGYRGSGRLRVHRQDGSLYLVDHFPNRAAALDHLRGVEVRQERVYVIAETSLDGSYGRDLVMIFDEADGSIIEFGKRDALDSPTRSATDCARCGYPVIPMDAPMIEPGPNVTVSWYLQLDEMKRAGLGFACESCGALSCASCQPESGQAEQPDGVLAPACWMPGCGGAMEPFTE